MFKLWTRLNSVFSKLLFKNPEIRGKNFWAHSKEKYEERFWNRQTSKGTARVECTAKTNTLILLEWDFYLKVSREVLLYVWASLASSQTVFYSVFRWSGTRYIAWFYAFDSRFWKISWTFGNHCPKLNFIYFEYPLFLVFKNCNFVNFWIKAHGKNQPSFWPPNWRSYWQLSALDFYCSLKLIQHSSITTVW